MKFVVAAMLVLFLQQHDPMMHMPGMQMQHEQPKKKPAKKKRVGQAPPPVPTDEAPVVHTEMHHAEPTPDIKVITEAPLSSSAIAALHPANTLKSDEFDAPKGSQ